MRPALQRPSGPLPDSGRNSSPAGCRPSRNSRPGLRCPGRIGRLGGAGLTPGWGVVAAEARRVHPAALPAVWLHAGGAGPAGNGWALHFHASLHPRQPVPTSTQAFQIACFRGGLPGGGNSNAFFLIFFVFLDFGKFSVFFLSFLRIFEVFVFFCFLCRVFRGSVLRSTPALQFTQIRPLLQGRGWMYGCECLGIGPGGHYWKHEGGV